MLSKYKLRSGWVDITQDFKKKNMSKELENLHDSLTASIAKHGLQETIQLVVRVSEDTCEDWSNISVDVSLLTSIMSLIDHYNKTRLGIPNDVSEQLAELVRSKHRGLSETSRIE